jgi:hypothetical protein
MINNNIPIDTKQAINDLVDSAQDKTLRLASDEGATIPRDDGSTFSSSHGTAVRSNQAPTPSTITSPLTESTTVPRVLWPDDIYTDSAGFFCYIVKPVHEITYNTSDVTPVPITFILKEPHT